MKPYVYGKLKLRETKKKHSASVYADLDHAGDYVDRKSTSGVCTFMGCYLTPWFSKKQTALAISTTEAEYVSAGKACQQALWMIQALVDYGVRLDDIPIMCDNKGAIDLLVLEGVTEEVVQQPELELGKNKRNKTPKDFRPEFQLYLIEGTKDEKEAINDGMDSIMGNNTWVLADLPPGCKPLGCKWIFKRKLKVDGTIEKFKARLVIQGFKQKSGIDYFDTYAPVAHISTIRLLIVMTSIHNLVIHQMDVKTTFLNGDLDEEVYMNQPQGFIMPGNENKVCKPIKCFYGLKQAPKQWHQKFNEVVLSNGYLLNQADKYVYNKFDKTGKGVIICLYVDDTLIFGTDQVQVDMTKEFLSSRFSIKDMGEAGVILGIRIKHESNGIAISQSCYIKKVLEKFNYFDCTPVSTLMDTSEKLMPNNGQAISQLEYSRVIGYLMYAMTCTRPDISFVVGKLSMYTSNHGTQHWQTIQRAPKKQICITGSTMEYEFIALAAAGKEVEWLKKLLLEIPLWSKPIAPISICCDSAATLAKAYSQMYNGKSRHLDIRHSMIRKLITNVVVFIEFVRSQQNLVDHLTKGLARDLVIKSAEGMGLKSAWFLRSLVPRPLAENKKEHRWLALGCESGTNSGVRIPRDLHPRLPSEEFVMSKLPYDAIDRADGDLRAILDSMVWRHPNATIDDTRPAAGSFSIADVHRLSAHVIKLRDMPEGVLVLCGLSRVWKSRVCDPVLRGANGNVMGIHDFLCLPEWTGSEVQEEPHHDNKPTLQRLPFYYTLPAAADTDIPDPTLEDLAVGTPSSKILAKAEALQKRKASTSGATLIHVAKRTRFTLAQLSGSTTRPSLFVGDSDDESDGDDDVCVEIPLVTPLCSAAVIPFLGNQGGSSAAPATEGSNTQGMSLEMLFMRSSSLFLLVLIMPPILKVVLLGIASFTREEWDASYRPTFRVLTKEVFKDPAIYKTVVDQFPTPGEMVRVKSLSDDQLAVKMSVLHCMMMLHGGELLVRYHGLNQSHQSADFRLKGYEEKVASLTGLDLQVSTLKKQVSGLNDKLSSSDASFAKSKAKGKERKKKIKSLTKSLDNLHPKGLLRKFLAFDKFSRVQGELLSLASSAGFERRLSMHQTKDEFAAMLKKMANFMSGAQDMLVEASPLLLKLTMPFLIILQSMLLNLYQLSFSLNLKYWLVQPISPSLWDARISHSTTKESTVTPASKSLKLYANVDLTNFVVASEHNEEMVNAEVDGSNPKMTNDTVAAKSGHAFMQGISVALEDVVELVKVGSGRASSYPNDVVIALFAGKKGDGLVPSSVAGEEAAANSSRV
ncbi:zinc finger, CCHC-type containing protein [Tanacetum coccineum]